MAMDNMAYFKPRKLNLTDSLQFVSNLVVIEIATGAHVREDPVALTLADVEGLAVARIDEPVDVGLQLLCYLACERGDVVGHAHIMLR